MTTPNPSRGFLAYFTEHRVAANLIMIVVVMAGLIALNRLPTQLMPDVTIPVVEVSTEWADASAESVEKSLTTPLENALKNLDGVEEVFSWSSQGFSRINVRYKLDADMDDAVADVTRLTSSFASLPDGAERPEVELEVEKEPVFSLLVTTEGPVTELRPIIEQLRNDLLGRGVAEVDVRGFPDDEIRIEADWLQLIRNNASIDGLAQQVGRYNQSVPGGRIESDAASIAVTTPDKAADAIDLQQLPVLGDRTLQSIASVERTSKEGARHYVLEGQSVVRLLVYRSADVDSLETSDLVYQWLDDVKPELPQGIDILVWWDMSELVEGNLNMLISNGLVGLLLVVCILFVFLNRFVAWWSAIGIPISIAGTFMILYGTGGTINFLSVFAFLMALGIIVDDAIVVGEETVTQMEKGKPANEAAIIAAKRMFGPIMASSLTTVAAFFPLLLLPGVFGEMLKPIPIVVIAVIVASLIECFLILPGHLNHSLSKRTREPSKFRRTMDEGFKNFRENIYRPFVTFAIKQRGLTVLTSLCLSALALAMPITGIVPFSPDLEVEDNMVTAWISFHDGVSEDTVEDYTEQLKASLRETDAALDPTTVMVTKVYEIYSADEGFTQIQAKLINRDDRLFSNADILQAWGDRIETGADVDRVSVNQSSDASSGGKTVSFFLAGRDLDELRRATDALKDRLGNYDELSDITDDLPEAGDKVVFELTPAARNAGLTETAVAAQLRQSLSGSKVQQFTEHGATLEVQVRLPANSLENSADLQNLPIQSPSGAWLRFGDIAEFSTQSAVGTLFHYNGQLGIRVNAALLDQEADASALSEEIYKAEVEPILREFDVTGEIQGRAQDIQEMMNNLLIAAVAGFVLIYFILVWTFGNYSWPIAVMSAIPFGLTGAIFGHMLLGMNLTFLSFFGLFGLSGIIINDSIILINRFQELRAEGLAVQPAIIEASCQRLRAVLLTSITTVGGLIPLLLSDSIQAQLVQSMAASLAFGISYGTVLVLLVIPCLLTYIESLNAFNQRMKAKLFRREAPSV